MSEDKTAERPLFKHLFLIYCALFGFIFDVIIFVCAFFAASWISWMKGTVVFLIAWLVMSLIAATFAYYETPKGD